VACPTILYITLKKATLEHKKIQFFTHWVYEYVVLSSRKNVFRGQDSSVLELEAIKLIWLLLHHQSQSEISSNQLNWSG
jgi:hypothetical protein